MGNLFGNGQAGQIASSILVYAVVILGLYFVMIRPNQKRKKQEEEMKKSLTIGDEVTTIGGIVGRVVSIKEDSDTLVIETASEKIRMKKWAIASRNVEENNK